MAKLNKPLTGTNCNRCSSAPLFSKSLLSLLLWKSVLSTRFVVALYPYKRIFQTFNSIRDDNKLIYDCFLTSCSMSTNHKNKLGVTMWPCDHALRALPYLTILMLSYGTRLRCWQFSLAKREKVFLLLPHSFTIVPKFCGPISDYFLCPFTPHENDLQMLYSNVSKDTMQGGSKCCRIFFC